MLCSEAKDQTHSLLIPSLHVTGRTFEFIEVLRETLCLVGKKKLARLNEPGHAITLGGFEPPRFYRRQVCLSVLASA